MIFGALKRPFVLLFEGRTGSTHLIRSLDLHPRVRAMDERLSSILHLRLGARTQHLWASWALRWTWLGRYDACGFKTKFRDVADPAGFAQLLKARGATVIHMRRRNQIKLVVSVLNASRLRDATGKWNLEAEADRLPAFEIKIDVFKRLLEARETRDRVLEDYIGGLGLEVVAIDYEDLLADEQGVFDRVFRALGVEPIKIERAGVIKGTSDDLRKAVVNFDELRASFAGTPYEKMFDE